MSLNYNTLEYFKDVFVSLDSFFVIFKKLKRTIVKTVRKVEEVDFLSVFLRIAENLPYGLFILFLGTFLVIFLIRTTESKYGVNVFSITTNSMAPSINPGDLLVAIPSKSYNVGDIITYKEKYGDEGQTYTGRILTHRVLEKNAIEGFYVYTAKGDNNDFPDPGSFKTKDISGKVILNFPFLGYLDFLVRTIPGFIIFILIPSVILIREAAFYARSNSGIS